MGIGSELREERRSDPLLDTDHDPAPGREPL